MKNKKLPDEDGTPPEILKSCLPVLLRPLTKLSRRFWDSETCSKGWETSILLPLPKKGGKTMRVKYGGISFIDTAAKHFATSLLLFEMQEQALPSMAFVKEEAVVTNRLHFEYLGLTIQPNSQARDEGKLRVECVRRIFYHFAKLCSLTAK